MVAVLDTAAILQGENATVFLDVGRSDGVQVGNSLWLIHRRDDVKDIGIDDEEIPGQVRGRLIVTRVQENHSTAVVVDTESSISIGDHVAMRLE